MASLSNILACWPDQYGSIDTSNINIGPLVIILWQNILGQQHVALNSLLTTLPNKNFISMLCDGLILYCSRKNVTEQTDREFNYRGHSNPMDNQVLNK